MEIPHLVILALLCVALVRSEALLPAEDYWQSIWPNTPVPEALWDFLQSSTETNLPIEADDMQYWTTFFQHDLHPGKEIDFNFRKNPDVQPFGVRIWAKENHDVQPFGVRVWAKKNPDVQPFGVRVWAKKNPDVQPFGIRIWIKKNPKEIKMERFTLEDLCEKETATIGEDKYCATSLESMMDFAISKLGKNIRVISSSFAQNQEQYIVEEVQKVGERTVMCHRLNFQKVAFYCHEVNATTTYMVPLVTPDGTKAKALTVCHHDTRGMDPEVLYQTLKVKPGTVPVCHFVGSKAIAWVPNSVSKESDHPCVI